MAARKRWRAQVGSNPETLLSRLGPQLRCEVKAVEVKIEAFGEVSPLLFDLNTAPEGVLRLMPGITESQMERWLGGRPFANLDKFRSPVGPNFCRN